ncbi:hypothetical protein JWG42_13995 [Desulfoprunum benzoelyticum]|uniref:QacE n=1 Tax=Desulfoprunum benzoelyticum TaxID=1506996 RepID=A0A840V6J3_9BACT|nr:DUF6232 family protein [Desulfoprunum benzoelyticum]MBB5349530.1 hypothetical protein [Desulfoprunum benzoelyticum]MBM9531267.1 hypothetical protein [Desulfoprunum benzoelyticum]
MEEVVFFDDGNVKVTNARFIAMQKTYAISAINSIRTKVFDETKSREFYKLIVFGLVLWGIAQLLMMNEDKGGSISILILIFVSIVFTIWWGVNEKKKIIHYIILTTSSGEVEALRSDVPGYVEQIEEALSKAIVYRS